MKNLLQYFNFFILVDSFRNRLGSIMVKIKSFATDVHSLFRNWPAAQNNFMVTEKVKPLEKVQGVSLQDSFKLILFGTL